MQNVQVVMLLQDMIGMLKVETKVIHFKDIKHVESTSTTIKGVGTLVQEVQSVFGEALLVAGNNSIAALHSYNMLKI